MARREASPQAGAGDGAKVTARQRRIEEQRRKIDQMRRERRRQRALWGTLILVALLIVIGATFLLVRPPASAIGHQVPDEGRSHVPTGSPVTYRNRPPASGPHYGETSGYGVIDKELSPGYWVHTLEHGGVVVLYRPDLCDQSCVDQLRQVYASAPPSRFGNVKMAVIPYKDMDHMIAVVAWDWVAEMDQVSRDEILAFYRERVDRGPEAVP